MFNIVVSELDQDYRPNRSLWRQSKSNVMLLIKRNDITAEGQSIFLALLERWDIHLFDS